MRFNKLLNLSDKDFADYCFNNPNSAKIEMRKRLEVTLVLGLVLGSFITVILFGILILTKVIP